MLARKTAATADLRNVAEAAKQPGGWHPAS
jgi:hypothetical protein